MTAARQLTHDEATELAGLFVLDALEAPERESVRRHLAECERPHPEFDEVGGVVPALGHLVEPIDAPAPLRQRVLSAIAAEAAPVAAGGAAATKVWEFDGGRSGDTATSRPTREPSPAGAQQWLRWVAAGAAVLLIVVLGAATLLLGARTAELEQRTALIADAIAARTAEGSQVATLRGAGSAASARGFAAFTADGEGYIVMVGLPPAPAGQTYQAWYIVDGTPHSAGVVAVGADGYALLSDVAPLPGTDLIAFTVEAAGGVDAPTGEPVASGEVGA